MKSAAVFSRNGVLYFHSQSRTTAGVWIATSPFLRIEPDGSPARKGEAAVEALRASQDGVPHPTNWNGLLTPLLELAGVKSWSTFMKGAKSLGLEVEGDGLKMVPTRNLGPKEGFEAVPEQTVEIPFSSSPDQVGMALDEAMARCQ
jgi:hypothetical protein